MLTEQERETLAKAICAEWHDCSEEWQGYSCDHGFGFRDADLLAPAVDRLVAAREGVWRAPIEALAADPSAMFEAMYGAASDPDGVLMLSVIAAVNALRAALGSVSAPGNEAGQ